MNELILVLREIRDELRSMRRNSQSSMADCWRGDLSDDAQDVEQGVDNQSVGDRDFAAAAKVQQ